jgi:hypothetical protein
MVISDNGSTGEEADSLPEHEALHEEKTPEDHEELSNVPLLDLEWQEEDEDDGTVGMTMLENDQDDADETDDSSEDVPETSESEADHIVVVSGVEVEWFDSDNGASLEEVKNIATTKEEAGDAKAIVKHEVEETVVNPDERPRQDDKDRAWVLWEEASSLRQAVAVEEIMDELDGVDTEEEEEPKTPRVPLHQALALEELMDELDDVDTEEEEEEAEAPRVSSSSQHAEAEESGGELEEEDGATERAFPMRHAVAVEEIMNESDGVETEDEEEEVEPQRVPLHQAMASEELMDELDDVDTEEEEEEAEAPRVSSSAQHAEAEESGGELEEEERAAERAFSLHHAVVVEEITNESDGVETEDEEEEVEPQRESSPPQQVVMEGNAGESGEEGVLEEQENSTQRRSELQTSQEIESEDEASDWSDDEKSVADDGESDIDDGIHSTTSPHRAVTSASSEHGTVTTSEELAEAVSERAHRTKSVATPYATKVPSKKQERSTVRSTQRYQHPSTVASSQPLKTLKKLQQMLDETDYMTAAPGPRGDEAKRVAPVAQSGEERVWFDQGLTAREYGENDPTAFGGSLDSIDKKENNTEGDKLWTSKDRMKYKKQQQRIRRAKAEQRRIEKQLLSPPLYPNTSDGDVTDDSTDDGLGYTLPNLPVYFSDTEGTTDLTEDTDHPLQLQHSTQQQSSLQPPPPPFEQRSPYQHPGYHYPFTAPQVPEQNMGQIPPYMGYPPNPYVPYPPYGPYGPQQQQMYGPQQQQMYASQYAAWAAASTGMSPYGVARPPYSQYPLQTAPRKPDFSHGPSTGHEPQSEIAKAGLEEAHKRVVSSTPEGGFAVSAALPVVTPATQLATTANAGQVSDIL